MTDHVAAREALAAAMQKRFGGASPGELQFAQSVALSESDYGEGWAKVQPNCADSLNLGAIHAPHDDPPECGPRSCFGFDTNPQGQRYDTCFRTYENLTEAWEDFIRILYVGGAKGGQFDRRPVRMAARAGDIEGAVYAMHRSKYFGLAPDKYLASVRRSQASIARALNEPIVSRTAGGIVRSGTGVLGLGILVIGMGAIAITAGRKAR